MTGPATFIRGLVHTHTHTDRQTHTLTQTLTHTHTHTQKQINACYSLTRMNPYREKEIMFSVIKVQFLSVEVAVLVGNKPRVLSDLDLV